MKKLILNESQLKMLIRESIKISYSPEKIDEFLNSANNDLNKGRETFKKVFYIFDDINLNQIIEDPEKFKKLHKKINEFKEYYDKLHEKYYVVVEMYDVMDAPQNVKELEKVANKIGDLYNDFYDLETAVDQLNDAVLTIKKLKSSVE